MEKYIRLEEEKARRHGKVYNWETAMYGKIWYDEDVHDLRSVEIEFPTIVLNEALTYEDWSFMENEEENHALVADEEAPTEFTLMAKPMLKVRYLITLYVLKPNLGLSQVEARLVEFKNQEVKYCDKIRGLEFKVKSRANRIESITNELELLKKEKEVLDSKLIGFQTASKDLDSLLESQRSDKNKEGLKYSAVPPPAQVYSPPKKDLSWTGLLEFVDDIVTDYSRPSPAIEKMDQQNPTLAKIPIMDTRKFEQWQFRIQQYLHHENYALWEVIEFGNSYEAPAVNPTTGSASNGTGKKKERTVTLTADDMQKRKNDVKAKTTLLLSLSDEHQLRFSNSMATLKRKAQKLWGKRLIDCRSDLDTVSLDDLYNHLKVYESEVQKKSEPNSKNMAFISSAKHSSGNEKINIASVSTASTNVSTTSVNIRVASINQDTAYAYIASQSSGSQIKFDDISQIDEDDMEEMDIKWNMALPSMGADRFWKKTWKKISIHRIDMAGFDKSKNHALIADEETPIEFALMAKTIAESEVFNNSLCSKAFKKNSVSLNSKITELSDKLCDAKNMIYHYKLALAQVESRLAEHRSQELKYCEKIRVLEFNTESRANCIESLTKDLELLKKEKGKLETKLTGFQTALKDLDSLFESQRLDKHKEGLGYSVVPPPPTQMYSPPKKDMSWTGLLECADDTVTDYSRPAPTIESSTYNAQNKNPSFTETEASPSIISPKPFIKFVKANDSSTKSKTDKVKTTKKPPVKYVEQYRKPTKKPNVRGNQRNWNNLKSHQLENFPLLTKFPIGSIKFSTADMGKKGNAVKASAAVPRTTLMTKAIRTVAALGT
nr:hypothetical protein [Tanacetum cinerariifolium]